MMGNANNQFKELINEAIHNHFHDKTETEMILKDWLYGICEQVDEYEAKAKAYDLLKSNLEKEVEILIDKVSGFPYVDAPIESTIGYFDHVLKMMKKYESGERNES